MTNAPKPSSKQPQDDTMSSVSSTCRGGFGSERVPAACQEIIKNKTHNKRPVFIHITRFIFKKQYS